MADRITNVGQITNITGKRTIVYDGTGWTSTFVDTGNEQDMFDKMMLYYSYGYHVSLEQEDAETWTLTTTAPYNTNMGTDPTAEVPQVQWDLKYNETNKSILDLDIPIVNLITDISSHAIQEALKENKESILLNTLTLYKNAGKITNDEYLASLVVFKHMQKGWKALPYYAPYLIKSAVASNQWQLDWSQANIGRIYKTATLLSQENVDERYLPTIEANFNKTYTPSASELTAYIIIKEYGWYKGAPQSTATTNGRLVYTQQWQYGLWPTVLTQPAI